MANLIWSTPVSCFCKLLTPVQIRRIFLSFTIAFVPETPPKIRLPLGNPTRRVFIYTLQLPGNKIDGIDYSKHAMQPETYVELWQYICMIFDCNFDSQSFGSAAILLHAHWIIPITNIQILSSGIVKRTLSREQPEDFEDQNPKHMDDIHMADSRIFICNGTG